jgi:hypothetical protein
MMGVPMLGRLFLRTMRKKMKTATADREVLDARWRELVGTRGPDQRRVARFLITVRTRAMTVCSLMGHLVVNG